MQPSRRQPKLRDVKEPWLRHDPMTQPGRRKPNCLPETLLDPRPQSLPV